MHRRHTEGKGAALPTPQLNTEHTLPFGAVGRLLLGHGLIGRAAVAAQVRLKTNQGRLAF